jgi:hypothetical protein
MAYCVSSLKQNDKVRCIKNTSRSFPHDKIKVGDILTVIDVCDDYFDGIFVYFMVDNKKIGVIASMFELATNKLTLIKE